jgi:hypothetical protein
MSDHSDVVEYFSLGVELPLHLPPSVTFEGVKGELFLSANLRLCGVDKQAHINSLGLAEEVSRAVLRRLRKRYGSDVDLRVVRIEARSDKRTIERIKKDSVLLKKRLAARVLSPNYQPYLQMARRPSD